MTSSSPTPRARFFRFADWVVSSPVPLPELEEVGGLPDSASTLQLFFHPEKGGAVVARTDTVGGACEHYALTRVGDAFRCRFVGAADFMVTPGQRVDVHPAPGTCAHTVYHLLLDHVLPRLLAHEGRLVTHAAAVRLGDEAIAFLGPSGVGKSTLAASFLAEGYPVESDDAVALSLAQGRVTALATYRSLRLWSTSVAGLYAEPPELAPVARGSEKRRLLLPTGDRKALPLSALFSLAPGDLCEEGEQAETCLRKLPAHEACMVLVENSFQLDASDRRSASTLFDAAAAVASRVPMYRLAYPRRFDSLPHVRAAILRRLAPDARRRTQDER